MRTIPATTHPNVTPALFADHLPPGSPLASPTIAHPSTLALTGRLTIYDDFTAEIILLRHSQSYSGGQTTSVTERLSSSYNHQTSIRNPVSDSPATRFFAAPSRNPEPRNLDNRIPQPNPLSNRRAASTETVLQVNLSPAE